MTDNFETASGTGGRTFASDQISSVDYPRCKVSLGPDGTANDWEAGAGAVDTGTARVTLASDDPGVVLLGTIDADTSAIKTAIELLDNAVDGNYLNVNANIAGTDFVGGAGAVAAGVQRVTLASNDPAVVDLAAIEVLQTSINGKITACNTGAVVIANSTGTISTNNSSTTPLGIDAVFTGTAEDVKDYSSITVNVFANQASATNGLSVQWSSDGTNWDIATETFTITASTGRSFRFSPLARYFRIVYTNGGTGQAAFRLQTILHPTTAQVTIPLDDDVPESSTAAVVRSVVAAQSAGTGDYINIAATTSGNMKVSIEELNGTANIANETGGNLASIEGKITACNTGAVVLTNDSIVGPGDPTIDSITQAAISSVTGANQSIVAAPGANKQIWVYGINISMSTAGTVAFQDEDDTAITGAMGLADTGGFCISPSGNFAMPLWKVATNKALEADVVTGTINGSITYAIVSV